MKTFEITYPNGEREVREATFIREKTEAGTKVLGLYKTVSEYSSESKPYLFITGYEEVKEICFCIIDGKEYQFYRKFFDE